MNELPALPDSGRSPLNIINSSIAQKKGTIREDIDESTSLKMGSSLS